MSDMESIIEDSLNDAVVEETAPETPEVESSSTEDTSTESEQVASPGSEAEDETPQVESIVKDNEDPAAPPVPEDDFAKRFGLASKSVTGRENRIPYSRVKKIIEKNEKDLTAKLTKEWQPKLTEYEGKVKTYEDRLSQVAEFEKVLEHDPKTFLERLSQVPAYKPFFDYVNSLASGTPVQDPKAPVQAVPDQDPRPLPNKTLADGSRVYDLEGLDALMAWQARQVKKQVSEELETKVAKRYEPIEKEWKHKEYLASIQPAIDKQIADARTWPHFAENEAEIVKILQADKNISLDGAYRKALNEHVFPKLGADRTKMRTELMAELKRQPASTAVNAGHSVPGAQKAGPRSLEDIIAEEIAKVSR